MADDQVKVSLLTDTKSSTTSVIKYAAAIGGAYLAVNKAVNISKELINAYKEEEQSNAKLRATLKATGNAAGFSFNQLKNYAGGLQSITTFGDEVIVNGLSILSTFKSIQGEAFERTAEAALDLAAVMGQDLQSSMVQLGKAVEDPTTGLTALSRVGVTFTAQEKEQIKTLQESNKLREAQAVILSAVEGQFKGAAQAIANTPIGKLEQLNNALSDLKEAAGEAIVLEIAPLSVWLKNIAENSTKAFNNLNTFSKFLQGDLKTDSLDELNSQIETIEKRIKWISKIPGVKVNADSESYKQLMAMENELYKLQLKRTKMRRTGEGQKTVAEEKKLAEEKKKLAEEEYNRQMELNALYIQSQEEYYLRQAELDNQYVAWKADQLDGEMQLEKDKHDAELALLNEKTAAYGTFFGGLTDFFSLYEEDSRAWANFNKALASTEAFVNSYLAYTATIAKGGAFVIPAAIGVLASGLAAQSKILGAPRFAQGGDFITSGPQTIMVGDNATGRERVKVEPLGNSGNKSSTSLITYVMIDRKILGKTITELSADGTAIISSRSIK